MMPIDVDNVLLFRNGGINSFPLLGPLFDYIPNASKTYLVVRQATTVCWTYFLVKGC